MSNSPERRQQRRHMHSQPQGPHVNRHNGSPLQFPGPQGPTVVQQMTPFNDVQTIAWMAAQLASSGVGTDAKLCVSKAKEILLEAIEQSPDFFRRVQALQKKLGEAQAAE